MSQLQPPPPPPPPPSFPGQPAGPYQGYPPGVGPAYPRLNGSAIASLVIAIAGGILGFVCCLPWPIGGVVAIVLGRSARNSIARSGGMETGDALALSGEIIGWILTGLSLIVVGLLVVYVVLVALGIATSSIGH